MAAWFEINKTKNGQFHFVLKASNGEPILSSETYMTKRSAKNGIASVQANCSNMDRYEKKESKNGKAFFNLRAGNNQVIGTSELYSSVQKRDAGVASVKTNGKTKTVKDNT